jgi:tetratricopeptide (TPR) repeat protein
MITQAKAGLEKALALSPFYSPASQILGQAYLAEAEERTNNESTHDAIQHAYKQADHYLQQALTYSGPSQAFILMLRAQALTALNEIDTAHDAYTAALKLAPSKGDYWADYYQFATAHDYQDVFQAAAIAATAASPTSRDDLPIALQVMVDAWRTQDDKTIAQGASRLARSLDQQQGANNNPESSRWALDALRPMLDDSDLPAQDRTQAYFHLAQAYAAQGHYDEALPLIEIAMKSGEVTVALHLLYAETLTDLDRRKDALNEYDTIMSTFTLDENTLATIQKTYKTLNSISPANRP